MLSRGRDQLHQMIDCASSLCSVTNTVNMAVPVTVGVRYGEKKSV